MHSVYVIQNDYSYEIYIGQTDNLKRRLIEHNNGRQTATKRKNGVWVLIYAEAYREKKDAVIRELRLKNHGRAKQELYKRIQNSTLREKKVVLDRSD